MRLSLILVLLLLHAPARGQEDRIAALKAKLRHIDSSMVGELLDQARRDPDRAVRRLIVERVGRVRSAEVREALARQAATDPDAGVAMAALERLRIQQAQELGETFEKRLALAHEQKDGRALDALTAAHQRWATLSRGSTLPEFLARPPAVFQAVPAKPSVRVLAFGDFGREGPNLTRTAAAAAAYHRGHRFDLGITVGDNFEPDGVAGPADPRWKGGWEQVYAPFGIPIFAVTGNHDWGLTDSPAAEILYSEKSPTWRMPALYYTFVAGPAQFFVLATQAMSETQLKWLERELDRSTARWKIVYGHHPVYSYGTYGPVKEFRDALLPVLANRADVYMCGHEHGVQHLKPQGRTHYLVGAAAGQDPRPAKKGTETLFADTFLGFTALEIDAQRIKVAYLDVEGKTRYATEIR